MAPLRRYIRLTPHTTLQALIFLEDPSILDTWLIHPTNPALPRIIGSLKDLILPKLREENERDRRSAASKKNKAVKDVVVGSDFEVSVFFKDGATRHAVVTRKREFLGPKAEGELRSNSSRMVQASEAITIADGDGIQDDGGRGGGLEGLRIENEDDDMDLNALPLADPKSLEGLDDPVGELEMQGNAGVDSVPASRTRRTIRARGTVPNDENDDLAYVPSGDEHPNQQATKPSRRQPPSKGNATKSKKGQGKQKQPITIDSASESESEIAKSSTSANRDEKKALFRHSYEAYTIYGKILYLIVKKLDSPPPATRADESSSTVVTRDIPIAQDIENTGVAEDGIMEGWMYMSQVIREDLD